MNHTAFGSLRCMAHMEQQTEALILFVLAPCFLYTLFLVSVLSYYPDSVGTVPFELATGVFVAVFAWLVLTNREALSSDG